MDTNIIRQLNTIADDRFGAVINELLGWLNRENEATMSESMAHEMLITSKAIDEPMLNDFERAMANTNTVRVAAYDLLESAAIPPATLDVFGNLMGSTPWLATALSAFAWKTGYPVDELDPANPPPQFTPAGQVLHQTGQWVRRQVQLGATERDQIAKKLAYTTPPTPPPAAVPDVRGEIPVRYFEFNNELDLAEDAPMSNDDMDDGRLRITEWDLPPEEKPIDIRVTGQSRNVPRPAGQSGASRGRANRGGRRIDRRNLPSVTNTNDDRTELRIPIPEPLISGAERVSEAVKNGLSGRAMTETRVRVIVAESPNGRGIPAVNVAVRYEHSRKGIAGTTNNNGAIQFSLPVRANGSGLTYEIIITWPLEFGLKEEKKQITLNANRPEYTVPFYARLS